jgi:AmpD protein
MIGSMADAARPAWRIDSEGWLDAALRCPSPNADPRPPEAVIDLLVLHNISLPPGEFGGAHVQQLFCNRLDAARHPYFARIAALRVSAHFLIERDGALTQFVSCQARAWHAGASSFRGRTRCNDFSIGIELEGTDFIPFTDAQYRALAALVPVLAGRYPLCAARAHSEIASARKTDPGPFFEWQRVAALAALRDQSL